MSVVTFEFEDRFDPWKLEKSHFDGLNLLVGLSGVGKTRILRALREVSVAASNPTAKLPDCDWSIEMSTVRGPMTWKACTQSPDTQGTGASNMRTWRLFGLPPVHEPETDSEGATEFVSEEVLDEHGNVIVSRHGDEIQLEGRPAPLLKNSESVVSSLRREEAIQPLFSALSKVKFSIAPRLTFWPYNERMLTKAEPKFDTLQDLQSDTSLPLIARGYCLSRKFPEAFGAVIDAYRNIFPHVEDLQIIRRSETMAGEDNPPRPLLDTVELAFRETGVEGWITADRMSSGMHRTAMHLLELTLSPHGAVFLIDEYENSMGINCLPQVTEHVLESSQRLQFIMTSHHPYVINNVPKTHWHIVTRHGSTVRVRPASHFRRLNSASNLDAFVQLMNTKEFKAGIE